MFIYVTFQPVSVFIFFLFIFFYPFISFAFLSRFGSGWGGGAGCLTLKIITFKIPQLALLCFVGISRVSTRIFPAFRQQLRSFIPGSGLSVFAGVSPSVCRGRAPGSREGSGKGGRELRSAFQVEGSALGQRSPGTGEAARHPSKGGRGRTDTPGAPQDLAGPPRPERR